MKRAHNISSVTGACVVCTAPAESTGDGGIFPVCDPVSVKAINEAVDQAVIMAKGSPSNVPAQRSP